MIIPIYIQWFSEHVLDRLRQPLAKAPWNVDQLAQSIAQRPANSRIEIVRNDRKHPPNSISQPLSSTSPEHSTTTTKDNRQRHRLQTGLANRILSIEKSSKSVRCEPGVTMEELVDALLEHHLLPEVVPQFKALTVAGRIAGAGLESSAFRYGQFADALLEVTYLLSNGQIVTCSPTEHSDLFYGALGSCGTFGLLISVTLRLLDVPPDCFVRCQYVRRNEPIESFSSVENDEEYLDGIVFSDSSVIIRGKRVKKSSIGVKEKIRRLSRAWDPCFYQHVKEVHQKSNPSSVCEYIPLKDHLFRYDRGACWMGRYPINPFHDQVQYLPIRMKKWFDLLPFGGYNLVSRTLLSPLLTTAALYKRLHASSNAVINDMLLIQDVYIPLSYPFMFHITKTESTLCGKEHRRSTINDDRFRCLDASSFLEIVINQWQKGNEVVGRTNEQTRWTKDVLCGELLLQRTNGRPLMTFNGMNK